ncbi:DUF1128 domain-containing protein [Texcoconibacillus texcoconensis]|uniref:Uncharacterized protein YfkK (UPF0435 family) n=1 Tax=Texcoconibacillus texcoconensis TaxID=1095777 RepID=A0A840QL71_9BACI|nr:DUF1128 domain-containing protein [Texcoconibacillus texcoconensis]MBB5172109.1 uncharacterized protein YfkK (UPF0435 family) [Texcoconibacillus texcoconensis]
MDLQQKNEENLTHMVEAIRKKLQVVNAQALDPDVISLDKYDDVKEMYDMVMKSERISVSEMDAIVAEFGKWRK